MCSQEYRVVFSQEVKNIILVSIQYHSVDYSQYLGPRMLRQRTVGRGEEAASEGIFIGDVEEPSRGLKDKISVKNEGVFWKYLSLILILVAGNQVIL